ncbi:type I-E CRISPR-associated protein Cas6/Cse3/CasE [Nocardia vaccinii]|uniref:type I-E CRISPR-associated protein Cas6/Cse3/CasE n=1 Tax=Nocardia vaccinii TaxID=1822 RepID=UPI00083013E8|nr:type I-E CRISPR-associated protein Cas6/Cse3/CasE [Nocardia vaccinii]
MFLTRMPINTRRRGAQTLLASPQAMHAAVMSGYTDATPTETGRILWRTDTFERAKTVLFVASPGKPDFTHIVEQAGWPTTEAWDTRPYDRLLDQLEPGQQWRFRLTANPVHAARKEGWAQTKPLAHVTVRQQEQWLLDRCERAGFHIPLRSPNDGPDSDRELVITDRAVRRFSRGTARVTIATATFEGLLEVTDTAALRHTLTFGLGRAKSYGCGLMTLARPHTASS